MITSVDLFKVNSRCVMMREKEKKCWYSSGTCNTQAVKKRKERTRLTNKHKNEEKKICFANLLFLCLSLSQGICKKNVAVHD